MGTKVKGLLRGLRYISQIFDEKEPEMEIGFPTDVKHVAHIGWDGPSASTPSWMNEFKGPSDPRNGQPDPTSEAKKSEPNVNGDYTAPTEKTKPKQRRPPASVPGGSSTAANKSSADANRQGRRHQAGGSSSPLSSPKSSDAPKHSRRRRSVSNLSVDSPGRDPSGSSRSSRHHQSSSIQGSESPAHEQVSIPKHSRGRKSKGSGGGSSKGSLKPKEQICSEETGAGDGVGVVVSQTT